MACGLWPEGCWSSRLAEERVFPREMTYMKDREGGGGEGKWLCCQSGVKEVGLREEVKEDESGLAGSIWAMKAYVPKSGLAPQLR